MHLKSALFGLNFDAFEYSWDETGGATRIGLALLITVYRQRTLPKINEERSVQGQLNHLIQTSVGDYFFISLEDFNNNVFIGAALKCAPIMEWEFILASGRSSFY